MTTSSGLWQRLRKDYPPHVLRWVRGAQVARRHVPTSAIRMQPRPGHPADPAKVRGIRRVIRAGRTVGPATLVDTGRGKLKIADGYHRLTAECAEGVHRHDAFVVAKRQRTGPWSRRMHDEKLNV